MKSHAESTLFSYSIPRFGCAGAGLILLGSVIAAIAYRGTAGEVYSPLNHFISELGDVGVSRLAWVFNTMLIAGALCLTVFLTGLSRVMTGKTGRLFLVLGLITGLSAGLVGVFSMNHFSIHVVVAQIFFYSAMVATAYFSIWAFSSTSAMIGRWISAVGLLPLACLTGFLFLTKSIVSSGCGLGIPENFQRPAVWAKPLLEWTVLISVLIWVLSVSTTLIRMRRGVSPDKA